MLFFFFFFLRKLYERTHNRNLQKTLSTYKFIEMKIIPDRFFLFFLFLYKDNLCKTDVFFFSNVHFAARYANVQNTDVNYYDFHKQNSPICILS